MASYKSSHAVMILEGLLGPACGSLAFQTQTFFIISSGAFSSPSMLRLRPEWKAEFRTVKSSHKITSSIANLTLSSGE